MRRRLGPSILLLAALVTAMLAIQNSPTLAGSAPPPAQGAGLFDIIESIVSPDAVGPSLIQAVDPGDAFAPHGQPATDDTGQATITGTFEAQVNLGGPAVPSFVSPEVVSAWETTRIWANGDRTNLGDAYSAPDDGVPAYDVNSADVDAFLDGPSAWEVNQLQADVNALQQLYGRDVVLVPPSSGILPTMGHYYLWGVQVAGELPLQGCGDQTHEIGLSFHRAGFPMWPSPAAPYDLFGQGSHALVGRCTDFWGLAGFENQGSQFGDWQSDTTLLIFDDTLIGITNAMDMAGLTSTRPFAFRTPTIDGYQPSNSIATAWPHPPEVGIAMPTVVVGSSFTTETPPIPTELLHVLLSGDPSSCISDWDAIYEMWFSPSPEPTQSVDLSLYQFHSGQVSTGSATFDSGGAGVAMTTTGAGDGYVESYDLRTTPGAMSTYTYTQGGLVCEYETTFADDSIVDELLATVTSLIAEIPTPDEEPIEDIPSDDPPVSDTPEPEPTGTSTDTNTTESDSPLWPIVAIVTGIAALIGGAFVTRTRGNGGATETPTETPPTTPSTGPPTAATTTGAVAEGPCDRLRRLHAAAEAEAKAKRTEATESEEAAATAEKAEADARKAAEDAAKKERETKTDRDRAERDRDRPPANEEDTWMEDSTTGERITLRDLRLRREAAAEAWDGYQDDPSQESAEQTQQDWNDLDAEGARDGRRETDAADQARRQADLEAAETAHGEAQEQREQADQDVTNTSESATDARRDADAAEAAATEAEARAATLKRQLEECLGMPSTGSGTGTRWGGPMGLSEDCDGGCFPEGNVERRVLDTFGSTDVKVNYWVTVRPDSNAREDAQTIAGELRWWRDAFATTSAAINVGGAMKGVVTHTASDLGSTAASGASVIGGEALGIDIPTNIFQVPVVVLEGAAAASAAIIDKFGEWIQNNHVEWIAEWGYQVRTCTLVWVEIWKCENGVKKCVERVLEVDMTPPRMTGVVHTERYQPRENWGPRVNGLTNTHARRVQADSQRLMDFMKKFTVGPCGG